MVDIESKQSTGMGLLGGWIGQKRAWRGLSEERPRFVQEKLPIIPTSTLQCLKQSLFSR